MKRSFIMIRLSLVFFLAAAAYAEDPFSPGPEQTHREVISTSSHSYGIDVGGTADMDSTMTRSHHTWDIAFQNNVSLRLENKGLTTITNPRVIANDRLRFYSAEAMLAEFTKGAETDQDRVYMIWEGLRQHRHHDYPLFAGADYHDPVRFLCVYGGGFCDDSGMIGSALYQLAGLNGPDGNAMPFVRALHGHMMCEVWHDGGYQWMDIDQDTFFLDRENRKPVSGDMAVRDHDYAKRELAYGPMFNGWESPQNNAALFGVDDERAGRGTTGYELNYDLRPGEAIEFRWDNKGKYPWREFNEGHRYYGNSSLQYAPLAPGAIEAFSPHASHRIRVADGQMVLRGTCEFTIRVASSYTMCGARARVAVDEAHARNALTIEVSRDEHTWTTVAHDDDAAAVADMTEALGIAGGLPLREYFVRFSFEAATKVAVSDLFIETDLYVYPIALPRLQTGTNTIEYSDDSETPGQLEITHRWRESDALARPLSPTLPTSPENGATVRSTRVPFTWPAVEGCDAYQLRVSRRPDFAFPYRPNYDVILKENSYEVPLRGMFSAGETYYWRVRPRLAEGLWGDWSEPWTFTWEGPMVPRDVTIEETDRSAVLTWTANPSGTRPARYDIYGSVERGFSVNRERHEVVGRGEVDGNFIASVAADGDLRYTVDGPYSYWRVVAVDEAGVESCPSDYAEAAHPYIITTPPTLAQVGRPYRYVVQTRESIGDLQHRYEGNGYWEREKYTFELLEGPDWLVVDGETGLVSGIPDGPGVARAVIGVTATMGFEVGEDAQSAPVFMKTGEEWTKSVTQEFELTVEP